MPPEQGLEYGLEQVAGHRSASILADLDALGLGAEIEPLPVQELVDALLDAIELFLEQAGLDITQHVASRQQGLQLLRTDPEPRQFEMTGELAIIEITPPVLVLLQRRAQLVSKLGNQPIQGRLAAAEHFHQLLAGDRCASLTQDVMEVVEALSA